MATSLSIYKSSGYPTETSMRVYVELTVTYAGSYKIRFQLYDAYQNEVEDVFGSTFSLTAGESYGGTNFYKTFTGLKSGTDYEVIATLWNAGENYELNISDNLWFTTVSSKPKRPSDWRWSTSGISKGSSMNYSKSGDTITPKPLTAAEWLDFIERIEEFYEYCGMSISSTYVYRATNGVSKGSPMTTTQANAARYLIDQLGPSTAVPDRVSAGDRITASFINGLKNSLNSID